MSFYDDHIANAYWQNRFFTIAAGSEHLIALKDDGTVIGTGSTGSGRIDVSGWSELIQVTAGANHSAG